VKSNRRAVRTYAIATPESPHVHYINRS